MAPPSCQYPSACAFHSHKAGDRSLPFHRRESRPLPPLPGMVAGPAKVIGSASGGHTTRAPLAAIIWFGRETSALTEQLERRPLVAFGSLAAFALGVLVMFAQAENPFIYFRF